MSDMYLVIDGIKGESADTKFPAPNMVIQSFSFGASNPSSISNSSGGGGSSKGMPSSINIIKDCDAGDPYIFMATLVGNHYPKATLVCRKAGGTQMVFFQIDLTEVFISNYNISGSGGGGGDVPGTSFSMSFKSIVVSYTPQDAKGAKGTLIKQGYDVVTQKAV